MTSRRDFIRLTSYTGALFCCGIAFESCSSARHIYLSGKAVEYKINKSEFLQRTFVVLKHPEMAAPVYLSKISDSDFKALLMRCSHKGCEVRPMGDFLHCPCHGSEFSNTGKVLKAPATENLREFHTRVDEQFVYVELFNKK